MEQSKNIGHSTSFLQKIVTVKVDRPLGTCHPKYGWVYPVNYGYIPGIFSSDGEELDVYILSVLEAVDNFSGRCIAIIHRMDDDDDKLIVVPDGLYLTDDEIRNCTDFQEHYFKSIIIR